MRWGGVAVRCVALGASRKATDREGAGAATTLHVEAPTLHKRPAKPTRNPVRNPVRRMGQFGTSKIGTGNRPLKFE
jgi:hypothetical protein